MVSPKFDNLNKLGIFDSRSKQAHKSFYCYIFQEKYQKIEKSIVELVLYRNRLNLKRKLHNQIGLRYCDEICKNCLSTDSTDSEPKKYRNLCLDTELRFLKIPEKTLFRIKKYFFREVFFLFPGFADFETIN